MWYNAFRWWQTSKVDDREEDAQVGQEILAIFA
jgi:hypothetical protein